jgi:hypothetical protein
LAIAKSENNNGQLLAIFTSRFVASLNEAEKHSVILPSAKQAFGQENYGAD